ncbi:unnamed protein product [Malus baccata var. baccata]
MVTENECVSSKIVSKEASVANSSCRVYYGEAGVIPFKWESQPGTPKHKFSESSLPPLTPPPSYSTTRPSGFKHTQQNPSSKTKFLGTIFSSLSSLRKMLKAPNMSSPLPSLSPSSSLSLASSPLSASYSSSSSSSNSSSGLRNKKGRKNQCFSVSRMPIENNYGGDYYDHHHHHQNSGSPTSTLCFGGKRKGNISTNFLGIRGC